MAMNLSPQFPDITVFDGEGGGYFSWSASQSPLLSEAKLGAGKLVLHPHGFALPHYADCNKIGYVAKGCCRVGMVFPNSSKEAVLATKKGDAIPVPIGSVSWWYNAGEDSDVEIIFLGETAQSYTPAQFDYFFLTGAAGVLNGFSTEFLTRAYDLNKNELDQLRKSQTDPLIVKLAEGQTLPKPSNDDNILLYHLENAKPSVHVNRGGSLTIATAENFPVLKKVGLSANLVKLDSNSLFAPMYTADASFQLIYITKGSGGIQIGGLNGKNVLEAKVQSGQLLVVPKFFPAAKIADADADGLEYFSVVTSSEPSFVQLSGETSVYNAIAPSVLQAAFNVNPGLVELFKAKLANGKIFVPPKK